MTEDQHVKQRFARLNAARDLQRPLVLENPGKPTVSPSRGSVDQVHFHEPSEPETRLERAVELADDAMGVVVRAMSPFWGWLGKQKLSGSGSSSRSRQDKFWENEQVAHENRMVDEHICPTFRWLPGNTHYHDQ